MALALSASHLVPFLKAFGGAGLIVGILIILGYVSSYFSH
jgi:hypothetical protein